MQVIYRSPSPFIQYRNSRPSLGLGHGIHQGIMKTVLTDELRLLFSLSFSFGTMFGWYFGRGLSDGRSTSIASYGEEKSIGYYDRSRGSWSSSAIQLSIKCFSVELFQFSNKDELYRLCDLRGGREGILLEGGGNSVLVLFSSNLVH